MEADYKIISCAGFGSSGSGVVTDFLREFGCIRNFGDYEFRFLQDYGGVSTLEDALVHNYHRLNSDIAIQNFVRYIEYQSGDFLSKRYEKFFDGKFREISYRFLDKITDVKWDGYWEEYQILEPKWIAILKYNVYPRLLRLLQGNRHYIARYVPRKPMYFSSPGREYFYRCVREYMNELCAVVDPEKEYKYVFFDQLMPPTNIRRYENYCDSLKIIVVDRDPRDYYMENVLRWGEGWVPADVDRYIRLYRGMREQLKREKDSEQVLRLKFEDAVYHYPDFSKNVMNFLGLTAEEHLFPRKYFNPSVSINNTQLWLKKKVDRTIISKIEQQLSEYCYDFPSL